MSTFFYLVVNGGPSVPIINRRDSMFEGRPRFSVRYSGHKVT